LHRRLVNLTAGIYTPITALQFARLVKLEEDGSEATPVGLAVKFPEDGYTQIYEYPPDQQPVVLGNATAEGRGQGPIQGWPAQSGINLRAADVYVLISAMSATTVLRVTEID
jgi:hypothetical protein